MQELSAAVVEVMAHQNAGRFAQAEDVCRKVLEAQPRRADMWNVRGVNFRFLKRHTEAIVCFRHALTLVPNDAGLWSNLGNILNDIRQCEAAIACYRRALMLAPDTVKVLHNLGIALSEAGRDGEARQAFDRALELAPDNAKVRYDRSHGRLRAGDYAGGWDDYEARFAMAASLRRELPGRRWSGERYDGKRLIVTVEQGLGDTIWVARYFRQMKDLGGTLLVESRPETFALLEAMGVADAIIPAQDPLPDVDFHIELMSVPRIFAAGPIPSAPYITPPPEHVERLAPLMPPGRLRVGIIWGGSPVYNARADRDTALAPFLRSFALPGVQLFSLQKGPQAGDLASLPAGLPIIDVAPHTADLYETAAAVAHLDLVVMTDTAVAHLAGAMGKPVWLLLCRTPAWLWMEGRNDSPWYPSMRLFRQRSWGDWNGVFDQAGAALIELVNARQDAGQ